MNKSITELEVAACSKLEIDDLEGARVAFASIVKLLDETTGSSDAERGRAVHNLAIATRRSGDLDGARELYMRALTLKAPAPGTDPDFSFAQTLDGLGLTELASGYYMEAVTAFTRSSAIYERLCEPWAGVRIDAYTNMIEAMNSRGDYQSGHAMSKAVLTGIFFSLEQRGDTAVCEDDAVALSNLMSEAVRAAAVAHPSDVGHWQGVLDVLVRDIAESRPMSQTN